ncbi:flavin reductase [Lachnospiraceae bacterium]|uniref:flavodoxin family protein n=1 Tax=Extibacter sp. GGCC_0201 TaxID=2731209 RepID=UPI001AA11A32|nr:NAD(P)H-dependent oxidoreductase [Extibacter sp. GGCC_0201]MBO1719338.1 NAD(P)H-dependent oxidoreductase [Extibacter sp. GGCC_0201]BDF34002.1 flavin reductase [Lachnospiraceae bacterium]BDF38006.1 flavin reductase [Lachnospiraceae bacterium]
MKILMINGTNRKGSTYTIGKMFIEKTASEGDTVKELFLPKDMPEFCRGCAVCIRQDEKKCPDYLIYMRRLTEMIDEADLLVFTTPVLVYHVSGQMKAFLDHYGYRWMVHRPEASMFRKQAVCITTAAGGGMRKALRDLTDSLRYWGVARIFTYGIAVGAGIDDSNREKIETAVNNLALKIEHDTSKVMPSLRVKVLFHIMRILQKKTGTTEVDKRYWEEKGWLGRKRPWR